MVEFTGGDENKSFTPDKITSKLFLSSIRNWYKEEGVRAGVEKVGKPYKGRSPGKLGIVVKITILDMEKCLGRVIDEYDKVKTEYNASADAEIPVTEELDATNECVTFFFNAKNVKKESKLGDETLLGFSPLSSAYPLLKCGLETHGVEVPDKKWINLTASEMKYYLEGLEFTAKYGNSGKMDGIKPYSFMICENGEAPEAVE